MYRITVLSLLLLAAITTNAQNFLVSTDSTAFPAVDLNEVEVISSKEIRNNKIVELPAAVSVLNSKSIKQEGIKTLNGISAVVPNLFMPDYGTKLTSPIYLRGIGSRINAPSIGLYVDNVPYFEKSVFDFDFYDIERIEVLRGPQGTLYGRNTMGGIINIYTKDPGRTRETVMEAEIGKFGHKKFLVSHSQPLGEKLSVLTNVSGFLYDGHFENKYDSTNVDALRSLSARVKLKANISRNFKINYSMNAEISKQDGYPYAPYIDSTASAGEIDYDHQSSYGRKIFSNNLQLKYINDKISLVSNTSYQYLDGSQDIDQDFTRRKFYAVLQEENQHMFSQEITVNSQAEEKYSYMIGMFAFTQFLDSKVDVAYLEDYPLPHSDPEVKLKTYDNQTSGLAFFLQSTISDFMIKGMDVIQGIRFDMERAGQDYLYNLQDSIGITEQDRFDYHLDFFKIMPKIAFSYQCAPNINTYGTVAMGYKTGGFNTTIEREEDETFLPEESMNYEIGVKSDMFDKFLTANLAFFYIDWTNQQIYQTVPSGNGSMIKNAGHSFSRGLEFELNIRPVKNLNIFGNYGLTQAKFLEYVKDSTTDYSGNYIPYVPKFTFHGGVNYRIPVYSDILNGINFQLSYNGIGKHYWREDNDIAQNFYGLLNSTISFENDFMELSLWGRNLLNEKYNAFMFKTSRYYAQPGRPLMIGTTVRIKI